MAGKVTLELYMEEVKPGGVVGKRSMLDDYADELKTLRKRKYTIDQICDYLKKAHGVDAKRATVATYLNRKAKTKRKTEQAAIESQAPQATEATAANQELPKQKVQTVKQDVETGPDEFMSE